MKDLFVCIEYLVSGFSFPYNLLSATLQDASIRHSFYFNYFQFFLSPLNDLGERVRVMALT